MNRMKELREERGISMKEAAQRLNMPYTTYVNYEKGMREPNSETLIKIADFYNTSIDYLLCKPGADRIDEEALDKALEIDCEVLEQAGNIYEACRKETMNPDIRMIARAGKKMTPSQAENLRKYAQYMFPEAFKDDD